MFIELRVLCDLLEITMMIGILHQCVYSTRELQLIEIFPVVNISAVLLRVVHGQFLLPLLDYVIHFKSKLGLRELIKSNSVVRLWHQLYLDLLHGFLSKCSCCVPCTIVQCIAMSKYSTCNESLKCFWNKKLQLNNLQWRKENRCSPSFLVSADQKWDH